MGPIFEGDGWFCVIAIIVSKLLADIPWLSDQLRLPGIVMISLIFALFYGPEPKRISKKIFVGGVVGITVASLLGELVGNFIGKGLHLRASAHLWHVSAFSCNRKFRGISCYMKKAPSHEDAFISFPYLVKGGLSSLNETGS